MSLEDDVTALRTGAAYARSPEVALLRLRGEDAADALAALVPSRLFLRDAQVRESLLLDAEGRPVADVLVCADEEDFLLLVEGLAGAPLRAHVERALPAGCRPEIVDASETHEVVSLHGPWAWHLCAAALGDDMVALPYLSFFRVDPGLCVRAGKTGEYGYDLVLEREAASAAWAALEAAARAMGAREVGPEALSVSRFENWFFDPAHVPAGVTPLELQLGWRLDLDRDDWLGRAAIDARLAAGVRRKLVCLLADAPVAAGDPVSFEGSAIGEVTRVERSPLLGGFVAAALVDVAWAHAGIDRYRVGGVPVRTAAPPLIDNRSLYVDPRRHTFAARDEVEARPLVRSTP